ncbi:ATP-binding cassette sub-family A member 3 [Caerostris darwini]|uniref:ATP-binding cassette sub-family A member 3 n=1 Tax=Caerostris darwini TaxID=1538125 RepID=A0AAV4VHD3_9ARAC|nr:ATP-binding cassette sub-family A member 3 [Caerostris darwini]
MSLDYFSTFFTSWQASVEETFIKKKAVELGKSVPDYKVWMQKFPYPEHIDARMVYSEINIIPWVLCYGYLTFLMNIIRRVTEEKVNGSKELLKMMGMKDFTYWISTFLNYFIIAFISMLIITILYKAPLSNDAVVLKNTDFMLLLIILTLFISSLILFSLAFSIFFNRPIFGIIAFLIIHVLASTLLMIFYFVNDSTLKYFTLSLGSKLGICLLPPGALLTAFCLISFYESTGEGANWSNITDYTVVPDINILMILGTMIFSLVLYIFIIWYFDAVWPWQPGVPKPFYFMFTKSYWCGTKPNEMDETYLVKNETSSDYFEEEPTRSLAGVVIKNLSKEFRTGMTSKLAVNDVSLNIYHGQITALLGHNGAGKTTTINILTGLYTPTSGTATINGYDILTEITKARRGFGVCPQHNVLYDTLTVEEHLKIYAAMKGVPWNQLTSEASRVLDILKLSDKRYELIKNLSGGMKRKLSLGIAVVGGSKVLFLDEPTSGMDVEARRSVWDALLEIRRDCTIILTTHYMEEADILGDRIAIMAEGEVQCCGSPLFLKQKFGTGYHLHVVKDQKFHLDGLTSLLRKHVPEVTLRNELEKEISFNLTSDTNSSFGDMFEELENQKRNLGVTSFGITVTTMEDVFLRVSTISDLKYKIPSDSDNKNGYSIQYEDVYGDSPGLNSYPKLHNQFWALIVKRFRYSKRHWGNLISQFVIPFVLMCLCLFIIKISGYQFKTASDPLKLDINSIYGETDGFYYYNKAELSTLAETVSQVFKSNKIHSERVQNPSHYVLDYGKKDISKYLKNLIVGGAIDKYPDGTYNLTAWYNGEPYHSTPLSLLLMHTALLQNVTNTGGSISLTNSPIPKMNRYLYDMSSTIAKLLGPVLYHWLLVSSLPVLLYYQYMKELARQNCCNL